jgi:putative transposase
VEEIAANEACGKKIELWFQDEARVGQKNNITPLGQAWNTPLRAA